MVPGGAAVRGAGVKPLLCDRRVRQRKLKLPCVRESQVQVFPVQLDAKARFEGTPHHRLAMNLEDARGGETAHQRLAHLTRIRASSRGEEKRFRYCLDVERDD